MFCLFPTVINDIDILLYVIHYFIYFYWTVEVSSSKTGIQPVKKKHVYYINIYIGVFENVAPHKNMLFDSENGDGPIDECIQGYLFFSQATRVEGVN